MVNVGFICEGPSDFFLFQSDTFKTFLQEININRINVINAEGCGNFLPHKIEEYIESLEKKGAEKIVIITDLDDAPCITERKQEIKARQKDLVVVAVKELEAWFLADSAAMKSILRQQHFNFEFPERELEPLDTINGLLVQHTERGVGKGSNGAKLKLAKKMLDFGYNFNNASTHENCPSVKYFVKKLSEIGNS